MLLDFFLVNLCIKFFGGFSFFFVHLFLSILKWPYLMCFSHVSVITRDYQINFVIEKIRCLWFQTVSSIYAFKWYMFVLNIRALQLYILLAHTTWSWFLFLKRSCPLRIFVNVLDFLRICMYPCLCCVLYCFWINLKDSFWFLIFFRYLVYENIIGSFGWCGPGRHRERGRGRGRERCKEVAYWGGKSKWTVRRGGKGTAGSEENQDWWGTWEA